MADRMFSNLMASSPVKDRRWRIWLLVAIVHLLVIGLIAMIPVLSQSDDEVVEIFHEPIILDDAPPKFIPMTDVDVKTAEPKPAEAGPSIKRR